MSFIEKSVFLLNISETGFENWHRQRSRFIANGASITISLAARWTSHAPPGIINDTYFFKCRMVSEKIFYMFPVKKYCPMGFLMAAILDLLGAGDKFITFELCIVERCVTPLFYTICTRQNVWKHQFKD